jgi:hypothetical protein
MYEKPHLTMPCTNPKKGYRYGVTENGKPKIVFKVPDGELSHKLEQYSLPCGRCVSCKLSHAKEWATRICHEAQTAKISTYLTLTFDEDNLPADKSVHKAHIQKFIKRLRRRLEPLRFKYFACGEYGDERLRPHYHVIILGWEPLDKQFWSFSKSGHKMYRSTFLEEVWPFGYVTVEDVTFNSAAYVARYSMKKTRDKKEYEIIDYETGEYNKLNEEFILMSKGIGKDWWNQFKTDTDKDYLLSGDAEYKNKVPRYYDKLREKEDPESLEKLKEKRTEKAKEFQKELTRKRLKQINHIKCIQNKMLVRGYELQGTD